MQWIVTSRNWRDSDFRGWKLGHPKFSEEFQGSASVNIYDAIRQSLADAQAYERGASLDLRVTQLPSAPKPMKPAEIRRIREALHASQALFAQFLCVSPKAVQSWEQGARRPQSTALRLLTIAKKNPQVLL